jgi:hypothetical protein
MRTHKQLRDAMGVSDDFARALNCIAFLLIRTPSTMRSVCRNARQATSIEQPHGGTEKGACPAFAPWQMLFESGLVDLVEVMRRHEELMLPTLYRDIGADGEDLRRRVAPALPRALAAEPPSFARPDSRRAAYDVCNAVMVCDGRRWGVQRRVRGPLLGSGGGWHERMVTCASKRKAQLALLLEDNLLYRLAHIAEAEERAPPRPVSPYAHHPMPSACLYRRTSRQNWPTRACLRCLRRRVASRRRATYRPATSRAHGRHALLRRRRRLR